MKNLRIQKIKYSLLFCLAAFTGCLDYEALTLLTSAKMSSITATTALAESLMADLTGTASQHGHCWSTTPNPDIQLNTKSELGEKNDKSPFQTLISGLNPGTRHFIRAYAIVEGKIFYGKEVNFETETLTGTVKELATSSPFNITATTANVEGEVNFSGGISASQHGHCWAINPAPTVEGNRSQLGPRTGNGIFSSALAGLAPRKRYYLRAYIVTATGTFYSNEVSFVTGSN